MKAFTDSKLWKKLSLQAEDLLESAKIWVANKVERDVQTLAALGLFAWDRVVKDVGRALPAAGTSARKLLLLTNTSSFNVMLVEQEEQAKSSKNRVSSLKEELNRPADEIKAVTRAIWDILSGESVDATTTNTRSLRTTAPAGLGNMAERQRRALKQRRKLDQQERDVTRVPASVIEAGYELQRELQAETSVAGYKTKPIRQAIQAGVVGTLKAVQETARLVAERGKKAERLAAATASSSAFLPQQQQQYMGLNKTALLLDLQQERLAIDLRLGKCIAEPENTWLTTDIVAQATMDLSEASLREIATFMVLVRDEMDAQVQADANDNVNVNAIDTDESVVIVDATKTTTTTSAMVQKVLDQLRADLKSIQELRSRVAGAVSFVIAEQLYSQILGLPSTTTSSSSDVDMQPEQVLPLVLRLDEFQEQLYAPPPPQAMPDSEDDYDTSTMPFTAPTKFVDVTNVKIRSSSSRISTGRDVIATAVADPTTTPSWRQSLSKATAAFIDFVDLIPDSVIDATMDGPETTATVGDAVAAFVDVGGKSFNAEIVTDDDFEIAVGGQPAKRVATFRGDDVDNDDGDAVSEPEQPNIVTVALLRSLDVVFFVVEKFFTVVVLKAVVIGTNVVRRLEETTWEGKGSRGWKPIRKTASAKGRY